ncbi:hypothetical protein Tco_0320882 [Tanacetum coccineum]
MRVGSGLEISPEKPHTLEVKRFLHLVSSMLLVVVVLVAALGLEFVLVFAPLELSPSQHVFVFVPLGLHLVSTLVQLECVLVHLESALVHLAI